jgi:hypothetical protein
MSIKNYPICTAGPLVAPYTHISNGDRRWRKDHPHGAISTKYNIQCTVYKSDDTNCKSNYKYE